MRPVEIADIESNPVANSTLMPISPSSSESTLNDIPYGTSNFTESQPRPADRSDIQGRYSARPRPQNNPYWVDTFLQKAVSTEAEDRLIASSPLTGITLDECHTRYRAVCDLWLLYRSLHFTINQDPSKTTYEFPNPDDFTPLFEACQNFDPQAERVTLYAFANYSAIYEPSPDGLLQYSRERRNRRIRQEAVATIRAATRRRIRQEAMATI